MQAQEAQLPGPSTRLQRPRRVIPLTLKVPLPGGSPLPPGSLQGQNPAASEKGCLNLRD